jgi:hypothetical protein
VDVASVSINGETVSENVQRKLHAMLCYGNDSASRAKSWSMSAAMPDSVIKNILITSLSGVVKIL